MLVLSEFANEPSLIGNHFMLLNVKFREIKYFANISGSTVYLEGQYSHKYHAILDSILRETDTIQGKASFSLTDLPFLSMGTKGVLSERKEFACKFFPFRKDPFYKGFIVK